ncbi:hypothetical protein OKW43_003526 [Paraburkholderia sp. WC7.3g]|uniref:Uncharacterized protein n=1 Tax=Paraburkholderia podalyriae TaxID=1938811 RepID=A0ABR7Q0X4_9BURK|nr:hypothetical protein [Paraburkholderia podalyriae]MBC8752206.1 hypothetical protein [Paraburkholderia podalyriae]
MSALRGLEWSSVSRAADMLTLGFGPKHEEKNFYGLPRQVSAWALHIQCAWTLSEAGKVIATEESLRGPDEEANAFALRLRQWLARNAPIIVESISANSDCCLVVSLSQALRLIVAPDVTSDHENWRFFGSKRDAKHLVIEGGTVAPESFDCAGMTR